MAALGKDAKESQSEPGTTTEGLHYLDTAARRREEALRAVLLLAYDFRMVLNDPMPDDLVILARFIASGE